MIAKKSHSILFGRETGRGLTILVIALLMLICQTLVFLAQGSRIIDEVARQEQDGVLLLRWREVLSSMQDAETGQRGFLLTNSEPYLEPYRRAVANIDKELASLDALLSKEPDVLPQVAVVRELVQSKLAELEATIKLARAGQDGAAIALVRDGRGKRYMDSLREVVSANLNRVRAERTALNGDIAAHVHTAGLILVSIALTVIVMVGLATSQLLRGMRDNENLTKRLQIESTHDDLTGLPNRRLLYTYLDKAISQAARKGEQIAVLFIDLDGFKQINDSMGHHAGDAVLRAASERFNEVLRGADLLARLGGDEFAVLVSAAQLSHDGLVTVAQRLLDALRAPLLDGMAPNAVGASIGIAVCPDHGNSIDGLMNAADAAMYAAKRNGKGQSCFALDSSAV